MRASVAPVAAVQNEYSLVSRAHDARSTTAPPRGSSSSPYFPLRGEDSAGGHRGRRGTRRDAQPDPPRVAHEALADDRTIPGTLSLEHLRENLAALEIELSDAEFDQLSG